MISDMFTVKDSEQIKSKGITAGNVEKQIHHFVKGFPFITLHRPATLKDGITYLDEDSIHSFSRYFEQQRPFFRIIKFVPASGAASRMFKHLFEFAAQNQSNHEISEMMSKNQDINSVYYFFQHIHELAVYQKLREIIAESGYIFEELIERKQYSLVIDFLLNSTGLDYSGLPKALLLFHDYPDGPRTAAEEHLVEAAVYGIDSERISHIHFTISPEHHERFNALLSEVKNKYQTLFNTEFEITFSFQKPSTDTIAVDENNQPLRTEDGQLLFRPGGHGALIDNLNEMDSDIVFIKNIDNVVPDRLKETTYLYKKVLGGYLIHLKKIVDDFLLKSEQNLTDVNETERMKVFARESLNISFPENYHHWDFSEQKQWLCNRVDRPMRICGMVKNEGEPGGGPFWVVDENLGFSLQIVESSQIDFNNREQVDIVKKSTHFNPVDLVCAIKNHHGQKFDLKRFVDENTGFISIKSTGGKTLKAQELPGLWNGAMANWITIFIEVPVITFNPVKTINDLFRSEHLAKNS